MGAKTFLNTIVFALIYYCCVIFHRIVTKLSFTTNVVFFLLDGVDFDRIDNRDLIGIFVKDRFGKFILF